MAYGNLSEVATLQKVVESKGKYRQLVNSDGVAPSGVRPRFVLIVNKMAVIIWNRIK